MNKVFDGSRLSSSLDKFKKSRISELYYERISTGFKSLDEKIGGGIADGLTVIGAGSGMGKSTFALQMGQNISAQGIPVLFFSMEMSQVRIASKSISRGYFLETRKSLPADDLLNKEKAEKLKSSQWKSLDKVREKACEECKNLYVIEGGEHMSTSKDIESWVKGFCEQLDSTENEKKIKPVVIVDYLQILTSAKDKPVSDMRLIVEENIRNLKDLSKVMPVILISSLNRDSYKSAVEFKAFKESGMIEYSADEVWGIQFANSFNEEAEFKKEKAKMPREVEISILKQRYHASESSVPFFYYCENDCFVETKKIEEKTSEVFGDAPRAN